MNENFKSKFLDRIQFILHKVVLGIVGWVAISWTIQSQNGLSTIYKLSGLGSLLLFIWFFFTTNNKSQWKAFGKYSNMVAAIITSITMMILVFTIDVVKIIH